MQVIIGTGESLERWFGINTTSPARTLHMVGNITVSNDAVARSDIYWDAANNRLVIAVA